MGSTEALRRTWAQRAARRHWWLMAWAMDHPARPLPMHRRAAAWTAGRLMEAEFRLRCELRALRDAWRGC